MSCVENIISSWKNVEILYENGEMCIIYGEYSHNNTEKADKRLGICWYEYPKARNGKLAPLVIQKEIGGIILSGLKNKAILEVNKDLLVKIDKCIDFLNS